MFKRFLVTFLALTVMSISFTTAQAGERDLIAKSTFQNLTEVNGLGAPDAKFVITSQDVAQGKVELLARSPTIGDQGDDKIVERSNGCSTGCSNGCSVGCSVGCSTGCSYGCSSGCR